MKDNWNPTSHKDKGLKRRITMAVNANVLNGWCGLLSKSTTAYRLIMVAALVMLDESPTRIVNPHINPNNKRALMNLIVSLPLPPV